jgi:hypothetical protein
VTEEERLMAVLVIANSNEHQTLRLGTGGPKDPPSDQSTYQDPNDDEDVQDEGNPDEQDDDECHYAELGAICTSGADLDSSRHLATKRTNFFVATLSADARQPPISERY